MDKVTQGHYKLSLKVIQKYYRQVTGKKESLAFYVDYIQPLKKHIEACEGKTVPDTESKCNSDTECYCEICGHDFTEQTVL